MTGPEEEKTTHDLIHELNNLLASIVGYADFLQDSLPAGTPQHKFAESILRSGGEAQKLAAQLLHNGPRSMVDQISRVPALNHHVLIAEEQEDLRGMMVMMIEKLGGTAESCAGGEQLSALLQRGKGRYHLLITGDARPEGVAGIAAQFPGLKIIVMAEGNEADIQQLRHNIPAADAVLPKPADYAQLALLLHSFF